MTATSKFKSLKKFNLSENVEEQVRRAILTKDYSPGDRLPSERELSQQFEVSRATIREALSYLQTSGLIYTKRGAKGGTFVSEINASQITQSFRNLIGLDRVNHAHLMEARLCIEPEVTRHIALIRSGDDICKLRGMLDFAEKNAGSSDKEVRLAGSRFHLEIVRICKNPVIIFILESITQALSEVVINMTEGKLDTQGILRHIQEHREILASIEEGDPNKAFEKTRDHLLDVFGFYSEMLPVDNSENAVQHIKHMSGFANL